MAKKGRSSKTTAKKKPAAKFPWIALLLLLVTIYFFWIYPLQKGTSPVRVTFEPAKANTQ